MKKIVKRLICLLCVISVVFFISTPVNTYALQTTVQDKEIIKNVTNLSDGKITVTLNVKSGRTIKLEIYPNQYIYGRQYGPMAENVVDYISNTSSTDRTVTKTYTVKFYTQYIVHATWSPSHYAGSGCIWDEHIVISRCRLVVYSDKYTWTDKEIKKLENAERIELISMYGFGALVACLNPYAGVLVEATFLGVDLICADGSAASEETIDVTPIKGYSYQMKYVGTNTGIDVYLLCYDTSGKLVRTTLKGTTSYVGDRVRVFK